MRCWERYGARRCDMDNVYLEDGLRMANRRVRERKEQKKRQIKQQENINAIVDFASNLFNVFDGSGISTLVPKVQTPSALFKSHVTSPNDYNGVIAGNMFRAHFSPAKRG